ncbi:MAG: RNA polymerase sigma factor [Myxococcales bacterium]|nr:RNA polymerase sigma factor [Myxococcales bacterium]
MAQRLPTNLKLAAEPDAARAADRPAGGRIAGNDPRIARAVAGDRRAASELLEALLPRVRNLVRFLCPGDSDVDDHAQAALIEVLRGLPRFEGRSALTTWADRITVRATLRRVRQARARRAQQQVLEEELVPAVTAAPDDRTMTRRQLAQMLDMLPEPQRQVLVLHHVMGMSVPEVAEALEVPFDTAKSRLRLATGRLRALYGEKRGGEDG